MLKPFGGGEKCFILILKEFWICAGLISLYFFGEKRICESDGNKYD
jgi:hypothetical protein